MIGCGGGSSGNSATRISGVWSGSMRQASGVKCSDGSLLAVGVGTLTRELSVEIISGDSIGEEASLFLDGCTYFGIRQESTRIVFSSDSSNCAPEILFEQIEENSGTLFIHSGNPVATGAELVCLVDESGVLDRE